MKKNKALAVLTAVSMLTGMSGCGNVETNSSDESSEITSTEIESEAATETEAPTEGTTSCTHKWIDATCTTPKTCANCGETSGSALGHEWEDATCTSPKTCIRCGATEGTELGHTYSGMTCIRCGEDNPNFNPKTDIDTIEELEEYLNTAYSTIETSFGTVGEISPIEIYIDENNIVSSHDLLSYDMYIKVDAGVITASDGNGNYTYFPSDLDNTSISDAQRADVIESMQSYQKQIADIAIAVFPDQQIAGGFYNSWSSGWNSDYTHYSSGGANRYFTWCNYDDVSEYGSYYQGGQVVYSQYANTQISYFQWCPDNDDTWVGYS